MRELAIGEWVGIVLTFLFAVTLAALPLVAWYEFVLPLFLWRK